jgi:hypothetical protein
LNETAGPGGQLRTWPWDEDRGPNPYHLLTGQARTVDAQGSVKNFPWDKGQFWDWLLTKQIPVLIEPLVKLLLPVRYLLHPHAGFWNRVYFTLDLLWTLATWALFGGAITRIAAVQVARKEHVSISEALRFTLSRYLSFFSAPLFPFLFVLVIVIFLIIFGIFHMIPVIGDVLVDGLGWPLVLAAGLAQAVILLGLVGWPMMYATISSEGSDSFDALSRSYSYLYQSIWTYLWYSLVALAYGVVVIFFVAFMGSLMVYLGKWGVSQTPFLASAHREPEYLFIYAPTSFGWRDLLLRGSRHLDASGGDFTPAYYDQLHVYNYLGAILVAGWLYLLFLVVIGFGYSFFWSVNTIIYLLMRRKVDDTEMDEVYLEDDEGEENYPATTSPGLAAGGSTANPPLNMVDAPTLKTTSAAAPPASPKTEGAPTEGTSGNPPPA